MRRTSLIAILVVLASFLSPQIPRAHAADVSYTADFEPNGSTIASGGVITDQYPFVTFDSFDLGGWTVGTPGPGNPGVIASSSYNNPTVTAGDQHGGSYSGQLACFSEFCSHGTYGLLNYSADSLSVYAGSAAGSPPIELDAYDSSKNFLGSDLETPSATGAQTLLTVSVPTSTPIAYFTVYQLGGGGIGGSNYLYIDDLTVSVPPGAAPKISVSAPASSYELGVGGTIHIPLTLHRFNGASAAATVDVTGQTGGVTASASDPGTGTSSSLTVSASASATQTDVPLSVSASAPATESAPPITITIQVVPAILAISAPTSESLLTCSTRKFTAEAQVAPGEPGSQVTFTTSAISNATTTATSPGTITSGLADSQVTIVSTGGPALKNANLNVFATLSNGAFGVANIKVNRDPAEITSVSPVNGKVAHTPQDRVHGSPIELYGQGLCGSATVEVGNQKAPATDSSVQHLTGGGGAYDYVRVDTPRLATTGPVTVTTGSPAMTSAPTGSITVDSYRNTNGWAFRNFDANLTWDDMVDAYGDNQTYFQIDPCKAATLGAASCPANLFPDPTALIWYGIAAAGLESGTCFGMSFATERIMAGIDSLSDLGGNPASIYATGSQDTTSAAQGIHGLQPVIDLVKAVHLMQLSTEFLTADVGSQLNATLGFTDANSLASNIDGIIAKGRQPIVQLWDGTGHILVAYDVENVGGGAYDIYVYDVNDQFTADEDPAPSGDDLADGQNHSDRTLGSVIHLAEDGSWTLASTTDDGGSAYHGGLANINVYDPNVLPAKPSLGSASSGFNALLANSGGSPGTKSAGTASSATITQVASGGKTLYQSGGAVNTDASTRLHATPFFPITGGNQPPPFQMVALANNVHDLSVSTSGTASGAAHLTYVRGGFAGEVNASTTNGSHQGATFGPDSRSVAFTGTTDKPVDLHVTSTTSTSARTIGVDLASGGGADRLSMTKHGSVALSHSGGATSYSLTLTGGGASGLPGTFTTKPLHLGAGSVKISKIHWSGLGGAKLHLTIGSHRVTLKNRTSTLRKPKIKALSIKHRSHHRVIAKLRGTHRSLPDPSRIDVVWTIRHGHHVTRKHVVDLSAHGKRLHQAWHTKAHGKHLTLTATVLMIAVHGTSEVSATASKSKRV